MTTPIHEKQEVQAEPIEVEERLYTADELYLLTSDDHFDRQYELDEGHLIIMSPTADKHGILTNWIAYLFTRHTEANDLGEITGAETGYTLSNNPVVVRAPDVGFIAKARYQPLTGKFFSYPPDLAVEVVSPSDTARKIRRKVMHYLKAGVRMVLVIYSDDKFIDVYQPGKAVRTLEIDDDFDGEDVLPGLKLALAEIFKKV
jgi:Uma2 family endonuclease